jgi:hypothetical protein
VPTRLVVEHERAAIRRIPEAKILFFIVLSSFNLPSIGGTFSMSINLCTFVPKKIGPSTDYARFVPAIPFSGNNIKHKNKKKQIRLWQKR